MRLIAAAARLIGEQGFAELRVNDVAERAGLSVGSFYLYFDGKDDLFTTLVVEYTAQLRQRCQAAYAGPGPVIDRLKRGLEAYLDFVQENERGFLYFRDAGSLQTNVGNLTTWAFEQHAADLRPLLEEGMRSGELPQQDPALLSQALLGLMQHLAGYWLENKARYTREQTAAFLGALGARLAGEGGAAPAVGAAPVVTRRTRSTRRRPS